MRELLPRLVAAQVAAASLSRQSYQRIDPLVRELIRLDLEVGTALVGYEQGQPDAMQRIAAANQAAISFSEHTVNEVRSLLTTSAD